MPFDQLKAGCEAVPAGWSSEKLTTQDLEIENLLSNGFKPSFIFVSGLTLAGIRLPVGDFNINWESYVSDAKVKFAQGNYVLATANGEWVKRPARYERDEYVYE